MIPQKSQELLDLIKTRRSVRSFDSSKDVTQEQIEQILEAARWAPSAGNVQDWQFVVVQNQAIKQRLAMAAFGQNFVAQAPVVIVVASDLGKIEEGYGRRGRECYALEDAAAAIQNILLITHSLGLGACWVGAFYEDAVVDALGLDEGLRPVALIPIGYPTEKPVPTAREALNHFVRWVE